MPGEGDMVFVVCAGLGMGLEVRGRRGKLGRLDREAWLWFETVSIVGVGILQILIAKVYMKGPRLSSVLAGLLAMR